MEKNIHNDGLEDFLRKSFGQYDDSPSDGLWDKIEADLADQPKVVPIRAGLRMWVAAAAAMLLALVVAGQYFYFQKEKAALVEIINAQNDKIGLLEKQLNGQKEISAENPTGENNAQAIISNNNGNKITGNKTEQPNKPDADISGNNHLKEKNKNLPENVFEETVFEEKENDVLNNDFKLNLNTDIAGAENHDLTENKTAAETYLETQKTTAPFPLGLIALKNIPQPLPDLSLPAKAISPVPHKGAFSIGAHHAYLSTREKMARVIRRPTGGPAHIFNNTKAMTGTTQMTGISAAHRTKSNWLLESGVDYRRTNLSTSHRAELRFMDRRPNSSGQQHDFEYALNTSAGVVDIEVRADQTDPGQTIDEFENITIEINADQSIDYVSIPFLIGKQLGHGRFNATVKSGVLFNFLTQQSFEISGKISNNNLRNSRVMFSRRNGIGLKNTTTDFMAVIGLNYELNKKWGFHVSPTVIVPMGSRHNDPYIKTSGFSAGVDLGFNFYF